MQNSRTRAAAALQTAPVAACRPISANLQ